MDKKDKKPEARKAPKPAPDQIALFTHELPKDVIDEFGIVPIPEKAKQFNEEFEEE